MKILLIQENSRHRISEKFRECFCFKRAFESLGNDVIVWGLGHENFTSNLPDFNSFDLIINLENYDEVGWLSETEEKIKKSDAYKMLWSIDAHYRGVEPFEQSFKKGGYNMLLHSTADFVTKDYHRWLPNCFDRELFPFIRASFIDKTFLRRKNFLGFCGSPHPSRNGVLNALKSNMPEDLYKEDILTLGNDMIKAVKSYKIHFNQNVANDINYRSFETIACGTVLFTNENPQYQKLGFINGKNFITYKKYDDIPHIINYYHLHQEELRSIALEGLELSKLHTYKKRARQIIEFYYNDIT
jgi:hypothetical protein